MRRSLAIERIRRRLSSQGFATATALPPAVAGRADDFRLTRSRVLSEGPLAARPVGEPAPCPEPIAFLDGVQRLEVVGFAGAMPIVVAEIAAAVRLRSGREFRTVVREARRLVVSAPAVLAEVGAAASDCEPHALEVDDPGAGHPLRALELARQRVDQERTALEHAVGRRFRAGSDAWLVVDGVLNDDEVLAADHRAIGVSKSHATLPFEGDDLLTYLRLPAGHRSSVFEPATWRWGAVHAWGLRLWDWEGHDLLHGLVRIEVAVGDDPESRADRISRWILAERVPLSRPDPRWDRLLYGVATVERALGT